MHTSHEALRAHQLLTWPGLGSAAALACQRTFGSFAAAFSQPIPALREPWQSALRACRAACPVASAAALTELRIPGLFLLALSDPDYPALLREIPSPPPLLYGQGDRLALALPAIAIVGSRSASHHGLETATRFAAELAVSGFVVASGLALGIDGAAHRGALTSGLTVAVVGCGIDQVYPRQHATLWQQIVAAGGTVISEFPPGTPPRAQHFPRRNRIISGLSLGVLVVEAAPRSGSLITARQALEQGREVFAIPGSIHNPLARGCHQLIREGATLVETTADIVAQLGGMLALKRGEADGEAGGEASVGAPPPVAVTELSGDATAVLDALGHEAADADLLIARTALGTAQLTAALGELELLGLVESRGSVYLRTR